MAHLEYIEGIVKIILERGNMRTKNYFSLLIFGIICLLLAVSCKEDAEKYKPTDTPKNGSIDISVDESFEPIMREQIAMYESSYPGTKINAQYKTEADCLKDFFNDSANRLVIVTRGLLDKEERYMMQSIGFNPGWQEIATDAIAIVVHKKSTDTIFSLERLQQQLTGKIKRDEVMVFDGLNKTSTVRFIEDSILKGKVFDTSVVRAVKNSDEVLDYVASHENAIGFVGINRIGNPEDSKQVQMLNKVKIALVQCDLCEGKPFILPSQQTILNRRYPLVRGLYYIIKENYTGLGTGFISFLKYERGQLIFRRAYLGPIMNFNVRNVKINEKLPED
jgi:phosphate transport system substrate-binding protein